ncbi:MAG: adenylate/guanylate cyclase domain-containing protein [Dehalococcoidia bacterium]
MAEREVRYCTTEDGVRIAYAVTGSGPPIVVRSEGLVSHVQLEWSVPLIARVLSRMARSHTLIRFDQRGSGMSDRIFAQTAREAVSDIEAVADTLRLDRFSLAAVQGASLAAIPYAARHPERVSSLILVDGFLRQRDFLSTPQIQAIVSAASSDYTLATEAIAFAVFGPGRAESLSYGEYVRACVGPEYFARAAGSAADDDVTTQAAAVTMPTLVIRHQSLQYVTEQMTRDLVAHLPDARLVTVPGLWGDDPERLADIAITFADADQATTGIAEPVQAAAAADVTFRTVLFTDLVGSTEMMSRLGDEAGREVLREHEQITREVLAANGGTEVKTMGDGFMASFGSVTKSVECAIALQRRFAEWNASARPELVEGLRPRGGSARPEALEGAPPQGAASGAPTPLEPLHVRIGLNAGEPIEDEGDLFGATVILASRIAAKAEGGEILVADTVRGLCSGKGFLFADRGEFVAKGFDEPVRVFEIAWRE